jgi:6-pyruvoyltetrahydropterin/6-carboxytetrahydropterin synthase
MYRPDWSNEKNFEVFGKCSNPNWHGHNYILWITVRGEVSEEEGFVINLETLKKIIHNRVILKLDHKNLNLDTDFLKGKIVTTENLAMAIWTELEAEIRKTGAELHCVKIEETENNTIEYYG